MRILTIAITIVFFLIGFYFSDFLRDYFLVVEYREDILIADNYLSGGSGSRHPCFVRGKLKSNGKRAGMMCKNFKKYYPELSIGDLAFGKSNGIDSFEIKVHVNPGGFIHMYNEKENRYDPGYQKLPILSFHTFVMLPLLLLLLYYLALWLYKRLGFTSFILLCFISIQTVNAQEVNSDTLVSFNVNTVVQKLVDVEVVQYDNLTIKKTDFDTLLYKLSFPEECLLCEISATSEKVLRYCSESEKLNKSTKHYESIGAMSGEELFFQPTLKLVPRALSF